MTLLELRVQGHCGKLEATGGGSGGWKTQPLGVSPQGISRIGAGQGADAKLKTGPDQHSGKLGVK